MYLNAKTPPKYLFRGTTDNFKGNKIAQEMPVTCTSESPFIAYLFAKEGEKYGRAVMLIFDTMLLNDCIYPMGNARQNKEMEFALSIKPIDAFGKAIRIIDCQQFYNIIIELGFDLSKFVKLELHSRYEAVKKPSEKELNLIIDKILKL